MATVEIPAKAGEMYMTILVDEEDAARLGGRCLSIGSHGYAQFSNEGDVTLLHRWILGLKKRDGLIGDHRNGNPHDNRRSNLRIVDASGSSQNVAGRGCSGYRGAYPQKSGRFNARIRFQGVVHYLGTYDTAEEAGAVAAAKRAEVMPYSVDR